MSDNPRPANIPEQLRPATRMPPVERGILAAHITQRISASATGLTRQWTDSAPINHFVLDELLPPAWAEAIRAAFPPSDAMTLKRSIRELKCVAAQMDRYDPLLEETVYAFQAPAVVQAIEQITGLAALEPDTQLYAGGVSLMGPGHFLNPHIDNSHDRSRQRYRILNLLYYVSPGWTAERGGNLELWPDGPRGAQTTIVSQFNRLVVMLTHRHSWHSVSTNVSNHDRCCVSNYFFSSIPIGGAHYYHVTEFRGRPEQPVRDLVLRADNQLRTLVRTRFPRAFSNPHFYDHAARRNLKR